MVYVTKRGGRILDIGLLINLLKQQHVRCLRRFRARSDSGISWIGLVDGYKEI